jgi:hypothetical protein
MLKHIWKVVRKERKWFDYANNLLNKGKENNMASTNKREVVNLEDNHNILPIGHKRAKDERYGKRKTPKAYSAVSDVVTIFWKIMSKGVKRSIR